MIRFELQYIALKHLLIIKSTNAINDNLFREKEAKNN